MTDRQQLGHLIAPPLIPLKSHQAAGRRPPAAILGLLPHQQPANCQQTASKQPATLTNTPRSPNRPPVELHEQCPAAALPCHLLTRLQECLLGRRPGAGRRLLVHTRLTRSRPEGADAPRCPSRPGTLLRRAWSSPKAFIPPAEPRTPTKPPLPPFIDL